MSFLDNIGKTITDVSQSTIQKGKDIADTAKYNSLISEEEKKMTSLYEQIGRHYVEVYKESPEESFVEYLTALKEMQEKVADYQQKINELKKVTQCPSCGAEMPNGALFCAACGAKIVTAEPIADVAQEPLFCKQCGASVAPGTRFCTSCGTPISTEQ